MADRPGITNVTKNKVFDIKQFNTDFEKQLEDRKKAIERKEKDELEKLTQVEVLPKLHELSIARILINFKDSLFETLDDLLAFKFELETFTKNNRLFYLGLLIVLFVTFTYVITSLVGEDIPEVKQEKYEIQFIYGEKEKPAPKPARGIKTEEEIKKAVKTIRKNLKK